MPTEQNNTDVEDTTEDDIEATPQEGKIETLPGWAVDMIRELRSEAKTRRLANKELQEAQRAKDQEALVQQGEYKTLAEELTAEVIELRPIKDNYLARIELDKVSNQVRIDEISETLRSVIPTDYAPDKLATWLDVNASKLQLPSAPDIDAGAGSGSSGRAKPILLSPEQKARAKMFNMTEEQFAAQLKPDA